jgi:hypothetical protein
MIHQAWRLSEYGEDNLGLACTEQGLVLGRTPLIERRNGRFVVRDQSEIECLLSRAYRGGLPLQRLMAGLANVAKALNGNDLCLANIARSIYEFPRCQIMPRGKSLRRPILSSSRPIGIRRSIPAPARLQIRGGLRRPTAPTKSYRRSERRRTSLRIKLRMRRPSAAVGSGYRQGRSASTSWRILRNGLLMRRPKMKPRSGTRSKDTMPTSAGKLLRTISTVS